MLSCCLQDVLPPWLHADDDMQPDGGLFDWHSTHKAAAAAAKQPAAAGPWDSLNITAKLLSCISTQLQACKWVMAQPSTAARP